MTTGVARRLVSRAVGASGGFCVGRVMPSWDGMRITKSRSLLILEVPVFDFTPQDEAAVASASKILYSRYRSVVDFEDVQQELYCWLLQKYDKVVDWRERLDTQHAERTIVKALRNAGEKYCRQEKAEREGYSPDDEFFYSLPMVADLLVLYFDPDWMMPNGQDFTASTSGGRPASEGGNLPAMVSDIGRGLKALPRPDSELLRRVYGGSNSAADEIAALACEWDVSFSAANSRVRRVIGRLRAALGGADPYKEVV